MRGPAQQRLDSLSRSYFLLVVGAEHNSTWLMGSDEAKKDRKEGVWFQFLLLPLLPPSGGVLGFVWSSWGN